MNKRGAIESKTYVNFMVKPKKNRHLITVKDKRYSYNQLSGDLSNNSRTPRNQLGPVSNVWAEHFEKRIEDRWPNAPKSVTKAQSPSKPPTARRSDLIDTTLFPELDTNLLSKLKRSRRDSTPEDERNGASRQPRSGNRNPNPKTFSLYSSLSPKRSVPKAFTSPTLDVSGAWSDIVDNSRGSFSRRSRSEIPVFMYRRLSSPNTSVASDCPSDGEQSQSIMTASPPKEKIIRRVTKKDNYNIGAYETTNPLLHSKVESEIRNLNREERKRTMKEISDRLSVDLRAASEHCLKHNFTRNSSSPFSKYLTDTRSPTKFGSMENKGNYEEPYDTTIGAMIENHGLRKYSRNFNKCPRDEHCDQIGAEGENMQWGNREAPRMSDVSAADDRNAKHDGNRSSMHGGDRSSKHGGDRSSKHGEDKNSRHPEGQANGCGSVKCHNDACPKSDNIYVPSYYVPGTYSSKLTSPVKTPVEDQVDVQTHFKESIKAIDEHIGDVINEDELCEFIPECTNGINCSDSPHAEKIAAYLREKGFDKPLYGESCACPDMGEDFKNCLTRLLLKGSSVDKKLSKGSVLDKKSFNTSLKLASVSAAEEQAEELKRGSSMKTSVQRANIDIDCAKECLKNYPLSYCGEKTGCDCANDPPGKTSMLRWSEKNEYKFQGGADAHEIETLTKPAKSEGNIKENLVPFKNERVSVQNHNDRDNQFRFSLTTAEIDKKNSIPGILSNRNSEIKTDHSIPLKYSITYPTGDSSKNSQYHKSLANPVVHNEMRTSTQFAQHAGTSSHPARHSDTRVSANHGQHAETRISTHSGNHNATRNSTHTGHQNETRMSTRPVHPIEARQSVQQQGELDKTRSRMPSASSDWKNWERMSDYAKEQERKSQQRVSQQRMSFIDRAMSGSIQSAKSTKSNKSISFKKEEDRHLVEAESSTHLRKDRDGKSWARSPHRRSDFTSASERSPIRRSRHGLDSFFDPSVESREHKVARVSTYGGLVYREESPESHTARKSGTAPRKSEPASRQARESVVSGRSPNRRSRQLGENWRTQTKWSGYAADVPKPRVSINPRTLRYSTRKGDDFKIDGTKDNKRRSRSMSYSRQSERDRLLELHYEKGGTHEVIRPCLNYINNNRTPHISRPAKASFITSSRKRRSMEDTSLLNRSRNALESSVTNSPNSFQSRNTDYETQPNRSRTISPNSFQSRNIDLETKQNRPRTILPNSFQSRNIDLETKQDRSRTILPNSFQSRNIDLETKQNRSRTISPNPFQARNIDLETKQNRPQTILPNSFQSRNIDLETKLNRPPTNLERMVISIPKKRSPDSSLYSMPGLGADHWRKNWTTFHGHDGIDKLLRLRRFLKNTEPLQYNSIDKSDGRRNEESFNCLDVIYCKTPKISEYLHSARIGGLKKAPT